MAKTAKEKALHTLVKIIKELDNQSLALDVLEQRIFIKNARLSLFDVIEFNGYTLEANTYKLNKASKPLPIGTKKTVIDGLAYSTATIRKDLLKKSYGVPIGTEYYYDVAPLAYKFDKNDQMFALHKGNWKEIVSTDWDF